MGRPERNTTSAASGSARMLNSAAGVQFPWASPPPIRLMPAMFAFSSGRASSRAATFVRGAVATMVSGSVLSRSRRAICSGARSGAASRSGSGRAGPSSPLTPCTLGAVSASDSSGRARPMATGARMPSSVQMRRALRVVFSMVWFPATELTPRMSKLVAASIQAMASSWPGSPSSRTGMRWFMRIFLSVQAPSVRGAFCAAAPARRRRPSSQR